MIATQFSDLILYIIFWAKPTDDKVMIVLLLVFFYVSQENKRGFNFYLIIFIKWHKFPEEISQWKLLKYLPSTLNI